VEVVLDNAALAEGTRRAVQRPDKPADNDGAT
jgi:hypothetical protein